MINKLVYITNRLLVSLAGLAPTHVLISFIYLNILLNTFNICSGLISFTNTNTAIPLANFKGSLTGKIGSSIHRSNFLNIVAKKLSTYSTNMAITLLSTLLISIFAHSGSGWGTR